MDRKTIDLALERNNLLKSMIDLVKSSIKDIKTLQYEITFKNLPCLSEKRILSNASSIYLLNELIKCIPPVKDSLFEVNVGNFDECPKFDIIENKELDYIESRLKEIEKDYTFNINSLIKVKELIKEIEDVDSFIKRIGMCNGEYTICKKSKIKFLKSSEKKIMFIRKTVYHDEKISEFNKPLNTIVLAMRASLKKEKAKLIIEKEELKVNDKIKSIVIRSS